MPNEDVGAEMYQYLMNRMKNSPLQQYEISNLLKKGHESIHNQVYWKNESYYGFGAGAVVILVGYVIQMLIRSITTLKKSNNMNFRV